MRHLPSIVTGRISLTTRATGSARSDELDCHDISDRQRRQRHADPFQEAARKVHSSPPALVLAPHAGWSRALTLRLSVAPFSHQAVPSRTTTVRSKPAADSFIAS